MTAGRPTKYEPEWMNAKIVELMKGGRSKTQVAAALGINRDSLYEWCKNNTEFSDTMKWGETLSQSWWEDRLIDAVYDKDINMRALEINVKNRFRDHWGDRQVIAHTTAGLGDLTDEELDMIENSIGRKISDETVNDNL